MTEAVGDGESLPASRCSPRLPAPHSPRSALSPTLSLAQVAAHPLSRAYAVPTPRLVIGRTGEGSPAENSRHDRQPYQEHARWHSGGVPFPAAAAQPLLPSHCCPAIAAQPLLPGMPHAPHGGVMCT